jgi:enoyl-CoA hydratase
MIPAQEALRIGLVDEVVAADHLLERGRELARSILATAPLAVSGCLEAVYKGAGLSLDAGLRLETGIFGRLSGTADKTEGTKAFLEKRPPLWTGR